MPFLLGRVVKNTCGECEEAGFGMMRFKGRMGRVGFIPCKLLIFSQGVLCVRFVPISHKRAFSMPRAFVFRHRNPGVVPTATAHAMHAMCISYFCHVGSMQPCIVSADDWQHSCDGLRAVRTSYGFVSICCWMNGDALQRSSGTCSSTFAFANGSSSHVA